PYFFHGTQTGGRFYNFLVGELEGLLEDVPLATRLRMWFHHYGDRETGVAIDKDRSGEGDGNGKFVESGAVRPRANLDATCALLRLLEDEGKS
ncbi:hypothetical protein WH47_12317, partial [Habropoda laboriosa]